MIPDTFRLILLAIVFEVSANAQALQLQTGSHYYALENLDRGEVDQRGEAGSLGIAFDNLFLAANTNYRVWILQGATLKVGYSDFRTAGNGSRLKVPDIFVGDALSSDGDGDGLHEEGEFVIGTVVDDPDSDDDGLLDGAEVLQGSNPLDGLPGRTGIIASVDTPGNAKDIAALDDVAVLALGEPGIAAFNIFNGMQPTIIAQVDTPGMADAVALTGRWVAVADGPSGVALIDISDPPAARINRQIATAASAMAITAAANNLYVGQSDGRVTLYDLESGALVSEFQLPSAVQDLVLAGDHLHALIAGRLFLFPIDDPVFEPVADIETSRLINTANGRMRLRVSGGVAYVTHRKGYDTIDVSDPTSLNVLKETSTPQFGWKQVVPNGSGLGIAAMSGNQAFDGPHNVSLWDLSDPTVTDAFLTDFPTPGVARAVTIFNGIAYVADDTAGLQVVSYRTFDNLGQPPTIALETSFALGVAEEGKLMRVTAQVSDDVQVRNVEFYVNGEKRSTDGNDPFEFRFITPLIAATPQLTLRARASDTGGNATWTDELTIQLTEDATPPRAVSVFPPDGGYFGGLNRVSIAFNEALDPASVTSQTVYLTSAGADGAFGTGDDRRVTSASVSLSSDRKQILLTFPDKLEDGRYRFAATSQIRDVAGNGLAETQTSEFEIGPLAAVATSGTPRDRFQASANTGQLIGIAGNGLTTASEVTFPTIDTGGTRQTAAVALEAASPDGRSGSVRVPGNAVTGTLELPGNRPLFLQIVPTVTGIDGGKGRSTRILGTGFTEGEITVRVGTSAVNDGGPFSNDGIDVWQTGGANNRLSFSVPPEGTLPYEVVTRGGASGRVGDVTGATAIAFTGTPADASAASANVGQTVTLVGAGFSDDSRVTLEAMNSGGTPYVTTLEPDSVAANGTTLEFTVPPEARTGFASVLGASGGAPLQIVPTITGIDGGKGRSTTISGTGFIEGAVTARFGDALEVVDGGPFSNDGIDVWQTGGVNNRLGLRIPPEATLPYEIVTEGGRSGRATDVTTVAAVALTGTPRLPAEASANVGQTVTLTGSGYLAGVTRITLEAMTTGGTPYITTIEPDSITNNGTNLTFTVPAQARTGVACTLNGGGGQWLQIVPSVTVIDGGRGRGTTIHGTGFIEGFITARFGGVEVVDGGPFTNDGIDVWQTGGFNNRIGLTVPPDATLPYEVVTEGGSSGGTPVTPVYVSNVTANSLTGTPAAAGQASANVGQAVTLTGAGFRDGVTKVTLEAMNTGGTPYITTFDPASVGADGRSLTFVVPPEARTGVATTLSGGGGKLLQIVPTISVIDGGRGRNSTLHGTGFIEGFITGSFGGVDVIDQGPFSNDGIDVWQTAGANNRLSTFIPAEARLPYEVVTEGGRSGRPTDVTTVTARAGSGDPAVPGQASANVGQQVTVRGSGYQQGITKVTLEAMNTGGTPYITTFDPDSFTGDGTTMTFTVPQEARTGIACILNGGGGSLLQIVPTITSVSSVTPGTSTTLTGTGFIEGFLTLTFGAASVVDGGPFSNDGIDVWQTAGANNRASTRVPAGGSAPVTATSEGGTSAAFSP